MSPDRLRQLTTLIGGLEHLLGGMPVTPCQGLVGVIRYPFDAGAPGVGLCAAGTQTCTAGTFAACEGAVGPVAELCNGKDDNCDGTCDEPFDADHDTFTTCGTRTNMCGAPPGPSDCNDADAK